MLSKQTYFATLHKTSYLEVWNVPSAVKWLGFPAGLRLLKLGNHRAQRGEKASDTRRVLSFTFVNQADEAMWEISFGRGLHGLETGSVALPLGQWCWSQNLSTLSPRDRQAHEGSEWIAYGGVPFKMPKQFPSDLLKVCFGNPPLPFHPQCSSWHVTPVNLQ